MTKMALIVGIDYYEHTTPLFGCVNDAQAVKSVLERNDDGKINFDCELLTGSEANKAVNKNDLKDKITTLFKTEVATALFYFAGHGHIETSGGYLLGTDSKRGDEGVSLSEILTLANISPATNKIIIIDCCHSGIAGNVPASDSVAALSEGLSILTACTKDQYATEENGRGVFTNLFVDALKGGAADLIGQITPGSVYAHIDQSLGSWEHQRPVFKTNVQRFISLREVTPPISISDLRRITDFFPSPGFEYSLDPTFEPEMKGREPGMPLPIFENTQKFAILQKYNRLNMLLPVDSPHMWNAAMDSKTCRLTVLGEHYRRLVAKNRI